MTPKDGPDTARSAEVTAIPEQETRHPHLPSSRRAPTLGGQVIGRRPFEVLIKGRSVPRRQRWAAPRSTVEGEVDSRVNPRDPHLPLERGWERIAQVAEADQESGAAQNAVLDRVGTQVAAGDHDRRRVEEAPSSPVGSGVGADPRSDGRVVDIQPERDPRGVVGQRGRELVRIEGRQLGSYRCARPPGASVLEQPPGETSRISQRRRFPRSTT